MKLGKYLLIFKICCIVLVIGSIYSLYRYIKFPLPDITSLRDVHLQIPMQIYSADGEPVAQYGEKHRIPLTLSEIPTIMIKAFIATEDSRFYEHYGIDPMGIFRAMSIALFSGHTSQGASTITQQLARNFFLSSEKTIIRKLKEIFLAIRIEKFLSKNEILELYLNKIYLGYHAYGVGAAAQIYFGKSVSQLSLSEIATIAGLPKAPSTFNPIYSLNRATSRRNVVLYRMLSKKYINQNEYERACSEVIYANYHTPKIAFSADYLTEMVRQEIVKRYGEQAYENGYRIYTTITRKVQQAAQEAVFNNVIDYDMRHGYRGPSSVLWKISETAWNREKIIITLKKLSRCGPLHPAAVITANAQKAVVMMVDGSSILLHLEGVRWARPYYSDTMQGVAPHKVTDVLQTGQQIWVRKVNNEWWLAQIPDVNSALVSINPQDGAILALVGGFDFNRSRFNRAIQAARQVGSNIKPFLYTAAMDRGLTLATILNDVPISRWDSGAGLEWQPKNSPPKYEGPIRLRQGLGQSKNVVMVRTIRAIGIDYAAKYLERFGFPSQNIVHAESLALGSSSFTPMQVVRGYSVLANGGFLVHPYFISRIENNHGDILFKAEPKVACEECDVPVIYGNAPKLTLLEDKAIQDVSIVQKYEKAIVSYLRIQLKNNTLVMKTSNQKQYAAHVINTPLSFLMKSALNTNIFGEQDWKGTGWRAARDLQRHDIGGKTGTTNSSKDAWFSGYGPGIVTSVWIGFDDYHRNLGCTTISGALKDQISGYESGAKSAQPAWNAYMKTVLKSVPEHPLTPPPGVITVNIDRKTGQLANGNNSQDEYFIEGTQPTKQTLHDVDNMELVDNGKINELF